MFNQISAPILLTIRLALSSCDRFVDIAQKRDALFDPFAL